jgi:integrase
LPKHVTASRDRHGKIRLRFRKAGFSCYLKSAFPSDAFDAEYQAALKLEKVARGEIGKKRNPPRSFAALIASYYGSPEFRGLSASTQATYRNICETIRRLDGEKPVVQLQRRHVKSMIGKMSETPAAANNRLRMLRILLRHALDLDWIKIDPTAKMKGYSKKTDGFHTWTEEEIAAFEARHPIGTTARRAMALMLYLGQRRGDAVQLGWHLVSGNRIKLRQEKTKASLEILMHQSLIEAIEHIPRGQKTFIVTSTGKPYTAAGFGNWFRERCNEAGLYHCSSHGLRKAAARRLAEAGNSANYIAAVTGHQSLKEVERYTRAADQKHMADAAIETMPARSDKQQQLSNPAAELDKQTDKELN